MNDAFDSYREMYYEGGISSVYLWDLEDVGFAGVVLMKKELSPSAPYYGSWDSIHVFEVGERGRQAKYSLTSTVLLWVNTKDGTGAEREDKEEEEGVTLSGTMTRQVGRRSPPSLPLYPMVPISMRQISLTRPSLHRIRYPDRARTPPRNPKCSHPQSRSFSRGHGISNAKFSLGSLLWKDERCNFGIKELGRFRETGPGSGFEERVDGSFREPKVRVGNRKRDEI